MEERPRTEGEPRLLAEVARKLDPEIMIRAQAEHEPGTRTRRAMAVPLLGLVTLALHAAPEVSAPRYPADLCMDSRERWIFTANEESGSVSMVSLASGDIVGEIVLDRASRPGAIALDTTPPHRSREPRLRLAVSETFQHRVAVLTVRVDDRDSGRPRLEVSRRLAVGRLPADLCFTPAGTLLVACEGPGEVWELDLDRGSVVRKMPAVEGVRRLALDAPAGEANCSLLAVAGRSEVGQLDLSSGRVLWTNSLAEGKALNLDGLAMMNGRVFSAHQVKPTEAAIDPQMIVWGLIIANRLSILPPLDEGQDFKALASAVRPQASDADAQVVSLDFRHRAAGDPTAVELLPARSGPGGAPLALVTSGGTDRLLVVDTGAEPNVYRAAVSRYQPLRTIPVGDRPVALAVDRTGRKAYVACYLDDSIVEVDLDDYRVKRTLRLGSPPRTEQHAGARVFFDSDRSRGGWYSCHSCHPNGGTRGHLFDTSSDGDGLAKKSPDLRGTTRTGPWSWLGRFEVLQEQVATSLEKTMAVDRPPRAEEVEQIIAFLDSLERPRASTTSEDLGGDPVQGEVLFERGRCDRCHRPPAYTIGETRDVGISDPYPDPHSEYNPPSLIGLRDRYRYLHDGRADSLWAVFREHNPAGKHGKASTFSDSELRDLIAFLKTL